MPELLQFIINIVTVVGLGVVIQWAFKLGGEIGKMKEKQEVADKKIDSLAIQIADCPPRQECTELFRKISTDIGYIKGKMDFIVDHVKKDN